MKAILTGKNIEGKKFKIIVTDMPDGSIRTTIHSKRHGHSTTYIKKEFTSGAKDWADAMRAGIESARNDADLHIICVQ